MKRKKTKRTKRGIPAILHIGPMPETITRIRDAMLSILKSPAVPTVQIEAVRTLGKMVESAPVSIANCTFFTGKR